MAVDGFEGMIAERQLTLIADDGEARHIVVRIGKPEPSPDKADFSCEWQIVGLGPWRRQDQANLWLRRVPCTAPYAALSFDGAQPLSAGGEGSHLLAGTRRRHGIRRNRTAHAIMKVDIDVRYMNRLICRADGISVYPKRCRSRHG
jgi:hypothetical protein